MCYSFLDKKALDHFFTQMKYLYVMENAFVMAKRFINVLIFIFPFTEAPSLTIVGRTGRRNFITRKLRSMWTT